MTKVVKCDTIEVHRKVSYFNFCLNKKALALCSRKHTTKGQFFIMQSNYNTRDYKSQVKRIICKLATKKRANENVIEWLRSRGAKRTAYNIENCARNVGVTDVNGIARIVKADFCRERLCAVCAWRRQARFTAQMQPVLKGLSNEGYRYIFVTLTVRNSTLGDLKKNIDDMMNAFATLRHRKRIKESWSGCVRSLELTYNKLSGTLHPHIHCLVAVRPEYFDTRFGLYISQGELRSMWADCLGIDYLPQVDIQAVDDECGASIEVLKYALKPTDEPQALEAFYTVLKGRRLVSFCGVFADMRKRLKQSDFDRILTDVDELQKGVSYVYELYSLDVTGGVYKYYKEMELTLDV